MDYTIKYIEEHTIGVLIYILLVAVGIFVSLWLCKNIVIFIVRLIRLKKYGSTNSESGTFGLKYFEGRGTVLKVFGEFWVAIINDFRHLLALIIVMVFFVLIITSIFLADTTKDRLDSIQAIAASLGGLIGSIIGYYFGENRALSKMGELNIENRNNGANPTATPGGDSPIEPITEANIKK